MLEFVSSPTQGDRSSLI